MARIPDTNPRFRTKKEISTDGAFVLSSPGLNWGTKYAVLAEAIWAWSEFDGKTDGCRYWSQKARHAKKSGGKLIHEHVVPTSVIIEKLRKLRSPSPASVGRVLSKFRIGAVITDDEDKKLNAHGLRSKMPSGWDGKYVWARYRVQASSVDRSTRTQEIKPTAPVANTRTAPQAPAKLAD